MHLPTTLFFLSATITLPYRALALPISEAEQDAHIVERRRATYSVVNVDGSGTTADEYCYCDGYGEYIIPFDYFPPAYSLNNNNNDTNATLLNGSDESVFTHGPRKFDFLQIDRAYTNQFTVSIPDAYHDKYLAVINLVIMGSIHGNSPTSSRGANQ
ncbi:hypothetical protein TSTA_028460 [Talaromyces stipitatus ATCC 10500]|uniref:Uncharacterized protein n=1 Tax=Talaromyces stipitatus (strain ATCC 10500 / CBS 375.48 / QM 6759 / NRRL 1006) TaxID=441959 RepID=B8M7K5_TALSN|nr:uncharacterized protein TSTA_028460 [Talaromyces stipitatus ATCC 10500]EED19558.1 hypothetical protein TSTA_028460 [Talaromyces stipitatus ATCC 10500]